MKTIKIGNIRIYESQDPEFITIKDDIKGNYVKVDKEHVYYLAMSLLHQMKPFTTTEDDDGTVVVDVKKDDIEEIPIKEGQTFMSDDWDPKPVKPDPSKFPEGYQIDW